MFGLGRRKAKLNNGLLETRGMDSSARANVFKRKSLKEARNVKGYVRIDILRVNGERETIRTCNLVTNAGIDYFVRQDYTNTSAGGRGAGVIALTSNTAAASATSTTLAGEITGNGLARADATTKSHTDGTSTTSISHQFTASGAHTAVQKSGLLNDTNRTTTVTATANVLCHEATFTAFNLTSGDQVTITWTLTTT